MLKRMQVLCRSDTLFSLAHRLLGRQMLVGTQAHAGTCELNTGYRQTYKGRLAKAEANANASNLKTVFMQNPHKNGIVP